MPMIDEMIQVIVEETKMKVEDISPSVRLSELGLSSYAPMRLLINIEDHFGCEIDAADVHGVFAMSVGDLPGVIERSLSAP